MLFTSILKGSIYYMCVTTSIRFLSSNKDIILYCGTIGFLIGFIKSYCYEEDN